MNTVDKKRVALEDICARVDHALDEKPRDKAGGQPKYVGIVAGSLAGAKAKIKRKPKDADIH